MRRSPSRAARRRAASTPSRSCAPSPRGCTTSLPRATSGSWRATSGRCAPRATSSIWRTSSCGRRRSSSCWPTSCATRRSDSFRLVVVLPVQGQQRPGRHQGPAGPSWSPPTAGRDRLLAATLRSLTGARDDPLYVHAKVGIVDDRWLTVGSANLNAHSLLNDTEMNVVHRSSRAGPRHAAAPVGRAPRHRSGGDRRPLRRSGRRRAVAADRRRAAAPAQGRASRPRITCSLCPASHAARGGCSARFTASSTTADPLEDRAKPTFD